MNRKFQRHGPLVMGGKNSGTYVYNIDRVVECLDDIKEDEIYFEGKIKNK